MLEVGNGSPQGDDFVEDIKRNPLTAGTDGVGGDVIIYFQVEALFKLAEMGSGRFQLKGIYQGRNIGQGQVGVGLDEIIGQAA